MRRWRPPHYPWITPSLFAGKEEREGGKAARSPCRGAVLPAPPGTAADGAAAPGTAPRPGAPQGPAAPRRPRAGDLRSVLLVLLSKLVLKRQRDIKMSSSVPADMVSAAPLPSCHYRAVAFAEAPFGRGRGKKRGVGRRERNPCCPLEDPAVPGRTRGAGLGAGLGGRRGPAMGNRKAKPSPQGSCLCPLWLFFLLSLFAFRLSRLLHANFASSLQTLPSDAGVKLIPLTWCQVRSEREIPVRCLPTESVRAPAAAWTFLKGTPGAPDGGLPPACAVLWRRGGRALPGNPRSEGSAGGVPAFHKITKVKEDHRDHLVQPSFLYVPQLRGNGMSWLWLGSFLFILAAEYFLLSPCGGLGTLSKCSELFCAFSFIQGEILFCEHNLQWW